MSQCDIQSRRATDQNGMTARLWLGINFSPFSTSDRNNSAKCYGTTFQRGLLACLYEANLAHVLDSPFEDISMFEPVGEQKQYDAPGHLIY
jgi:hypothetical protein